jgi:hypothetical protein
LFSALVLLVVIVWLVGMVVGRGDDVALISQRQFITSLPQVTRTTQITTISSATGFRQRDIC